MAEKERFSRHGSVRELLEHFEFLIYKTGKIPQDGCSRCGELSCLRGCQGYSPQRRDVMSHYPRNLDVRVWLLKVQNDWDQRGSLAKEYTIALSDKLKPKEVTNEFLG